MFDFEPDLGLKLGQTKPKISGTVPTNRHTTISSDSVPSSACFDDDPKETDFDLRFTPKVGPETVAHGSGPKQSARCTKHQLGRPITVPYVTQ